MLHDRDYMRSEPFETRRSATIVLIIILVACFLAQLAAGASGKFDVNALFALNLDGFLHGRYWQLLTFQFMHGGILHILFNCITLYSFGRAVEEILGKGKFLALYFASGFAGGALQLLASWTLPNQANTSVVGASAGIMGLIAAFTVMFSSQEMTSFFLPVRIRVQYIFWIALVTSIVGTFVPFGGVAHAAHLGGLLTGVAFIKLSRENEWQMPRWRPFQARQRKRELVKAAASVRAQQSLRPRKDVTIDLPPEEFISKEVDPILDKISAHGIQSLTDRERQILQAARSRMSKR